MGRFRDLLRFDDLSHVEPVVSYPSFSADLSAPFNALPPHPNEAFDASFALALGQSASPLTNTLTSAWPGVSYPTQPCPPSSLVPAAAVPLPAVPVQALSPGFPSAIDHRCDFQQTTFNGSPLDDWIDFNNVQAMASSNEAILNGDQLARGLQLWHHSSTSVPSSPTSGTGSTPHSVSHATSSLASSNCGSSPRPMDQTNSKPSMRDSFSCRRCPKKFSNQVKRNRHERLHEKKFRCSIPGCDQRFSTASDLKRHLDTLAHGGKKRFQCSRCQMRYSRRDNLQRHESEAHNVS